MKKSDYFSAKFENDEFIFLDQTKLPLEEVYVRTDDYERIALAIERLEVRGAPLIGIAAAYALALSLKKSNRENNDVDFNNAYNRLARTRPTAVNLFSALDAIKSVYEAEKKSENIYEVLLTKAVRIHNEDIEHCRNCLL